VIVGGFSRISKRWTNSGVPISKAALNPVDRFLRSKDANKGINVKRVRRNKRELAFATHWAEECEPKVWLNQGQGLVQNLFFTAEPRWPFKPISRLWLTRRERMVAATCIQWLGSNCGMEFLEQALAKCGYKLVRIKD
jgi:hypothetical protein